MAELEAVEVLILVVEDLIEDGVIEEGSIIATQLADLTEGGSESQLSNIISQALGEGQTEPQALSTAYDAIAEISTDAADNWALTMEEEGYQFEEGASSEEADFEDTDPDSDPDKGDPNTQACQDNPEGAECLAQTQSKLSKFFQFMKDWGGTIGSVVVFGVAAIFIFIGQVARWICQTIQKIKQECTTQQCVDQKCNTALCNATKNLTSFIRRFWIYITILIVVLAVVLAIFFRSITPIIVFAIILLVVMAFKSVIGNLIATVLCDVSASTCLFTGRSINC